MRATRKEFLNQQIAQQRQWINDCGADLAGYVKHYGKPTDPDCYGNGGYAIYAADMNELADLQAKLARCR